MTHWQRWMSHPQTVWLRRATFQLHMWSGIGVGLYVLVVSVTGSIVVYRNELYTAATRDPIVVTPSPFQSPTTNPSTMENSSGLRERGTGGRGRILEEGGRGAEPRS